MDLPVQNIELEFLTLAHYEELKDVMISAYNTMPNAYWKENHIKSMLDKFPEGQVIVKANGQLAGCALSIIVEKNKFETQHTYREVTGNYTFDTHSPDGDVLYGIDVLLGC